MQDLVIEFYLPRLYKDKLSGERIIKSILNYAPELGPEYYNSFEPVNKKFDSCNLEPALSHWGGAFLWKRKNPAIRGMFFGGSSHPRRPFHSSLSIHAKPEHIDNKKLVNFVQGFSREFETDIAVVHVATKSEIESKRTFYLSSFIMRENLPNLYWLTVFGAPYVKLFGKERLTGTPCAKVKELAQETISIQLTPDVMDGRTKPEHVESARNIAKQHLNSNVFFDPALGPNHAYSTPVFQIID